MSTEALLTLAILVAAIALFATEKLPVDIVAMLVLGALLLLGLVTPEQGLSGFSSEATVTVAAMFVLSAGLSQSGALRGASRMLSRIRSGWLFSLVVMLLVGVTSAFVNNTAAVAVFLPVVMAVAAANRFPVSHVLIPMSYVAQMGGVCTLIGTSTNLLVHSMAQDMGLRGFSMFEFAPLGVLAMVAGIAYLMLVGRWLLPDRRHGELSENYQLGKYLTELRVGEGSSLIGSSVADAKFGERYNVYALELLRGTEKHWSPRSQQLQAGDVLLVRGDWERLIRLKDDFRLELEPEVQLRDSLLRGGEQLLVEVMVAPGSRFIGQTLKELDFNWHYNATALAIHRRGQIVREKLKEVRLNTGDVLLLMTPREEVRALRGNRNLIVLSAREDENFSRRRALTAIAIMIAVVAVAALGLVKIVVAAVIGSIAMVLSRCLAPKDIYPSIDWPVIMLLAGVLPLGIALQNSGAATQIAGTLMDLFGRFGPHASLAVIYLITVLLTEAMSNNAAAVLMAPIAVANAQALDSNPIAFLIAVLFAASTSFATPVGYQTNTMVYNAGGYRFIDFVRIGVPLDLLFWAIAVVLIPVFWPL